jgi:hypothetical protein
VFDYFDDDKANVYNGCIKGLCVHLHCGDGDSDSDKDGDSKCL